MTAIRANKPEAVSRMGTPDSRFALLLVNKCDTISRVQSPGFQSH